jgi:hypothetical protein
MDDWMNGGLSDHHPIIHPGEKAREEGLAREWVARE